MSWKFVKASFDFAVAGGNSSLTVCKELYTTADDCLCAIEPMKDASEAAPARTRSEGIRESINIFYRGRPAVFELH